MNKILVGIHGRPSIKNVYNLMNNSSVELWVRRRIDNKEYWRVYSGGNCENMRRVTNPTFNDDVILRWGNEIQIEHPNCTIYNEAKSIKKATEKGTARIIFNEAGVKVPKIITKENLKQANYPVIARPHTHAKGKNIVILNNAGECNSHMDRNPGWYYSEFYPKEREVRVHVAFGKVLALMEKPAPSDKTTVAWNRAIVNEEWKAIPWGDYHYNACMEALRAVKALGLKTGGVDVMIIGEEAVVLEVNTAPTLISSPYVSQRYAELFNWLFRGEKKKEWDFEQFKKAASLAWKHNQLSE